MTQRATDKSGQKPAIDLAHLESLEPVARHRGRNMSKASVFFYGAAGAGVAVKTYEEGNVVARNLAGRWLIAREARAYEVAAGVAGLPDFFGRTGAFSLVTAWVDAEPLAQHRGVSVDPLVFDRIDEIIEALHERGVALGDLHHRDVLLSDDGSVWLIDLAAALCLGDRPGRIRRQMFERFRESDLINVTRMRARFTGGDVEAALGALDQEMVARYRRGRSIKAAWDRLRGKRNS